MSFTATVENDTIKLPHGLHLPDGTKVNIEPVPQAEAPEPISEPRQTFYERYKDVIGSGEGPTDMAENHDHYASGAPKRSS